MITYHIEALLQGAWTKICHPSFQNFEGLCNAKRFTKQYAIGTVKHRIIDSKNNTVVVIINTKGEEEDLI